jgi:hypothetical protein
VRIFLLFILLFLFQMSFIQQHNSIRNTPRDEHIIIDIDEKTDSFSKFLYPSKISPNMMTIKMIEILNDTVINMQVPAIDRPVTQQCRFRFIKASDAGKFYN